MQPLSPQLLAALQARGILPGGAAPPAPTPNFTPAPPAMSPVNPPATTQAQAQFIPPALSGRTDQLARLAALGQTVGATASTPPAPSQAVNYQPPGGSGSGGSSGAGADSEGLTLPPATNTTVPGKAVSLVSPQVESEANQAIGEEAEAANSEVGAEAAANEGEADSIDRQQTRIGEEAAKSEEREAQRRQAFQAAFDEVKATAREAATGKIDYKRAFRNLNTGQRVLGGIADFFGSFGAAVQHRDYTSVFEKIAARDVAEQKDDLQNKWKGAEAKESLLLGRMEGHFKDERVAEQATTAIRLQQYGLAAVAEAKRAQSPVLLAKAQKLQADLDAKAADIHRSMQQWQPSHTAAVGFDRTKMDKYVEDKLKESKGEVAIPDAQREYLAIHGYARPGSPNVYGTKPNEWEKREVLAHQNALANIDELLRLREKHGGGAVFAPDDKARADALAARTQEQLVAAFGRTNKGLLDRTSHLIPDNPLSVKLSGAIGADEIGTRLRSARQMLQDELDRSQGKEPSNVQRLQTPIGGSR